MKLYFVIGEEVIGNVSKGMKILHIAFSHAEAVTTIAFFPHESFCYVHDARIFEIEAKEFNKLGEITS